MRVTSGWCKKHLVELCEKCPDPEEDKN
jgi:hypothetical protein